ncbi:MAG: hypothetical protein AB7T38_02665 [Nitrospirales bacterium]
MSCDVFGRPMSTVPNPGDWVPQLLPPPELTQEYIDELVARALAQRRLGETYRPIESSRHSGRACRMVGRLSNHAFS